jgi:hypothetical protein
VWCESWKADERPNGYEAVKQAITGALRKGLIKGTLEWQTEVDFNGNDIGDIVGVAEPDRSTVERSSLESWLIARNVRSGFFFPDVVDTPDYLAPSNPRYAPKLAAAVSAWMAVTEPGAKSPKQALDKWLRENAATFGLTDDDGNPINNAIEECSKVANWQPGGGVPKTPGG